MSDMEILRLADKCGVTAVSKHEWDGKRFNHTDDLLDGDFAGLIQFARLLIAEEREACAKVAEEVMRRYKTDTALDPNLNKVGAMSAELCALWIRKRGEK